MCGRYTLHHDIDAVADRFGAQEVLFDLPPRYNIAPTQPVAAITSVHGERLLEGLRWGLVPFWAKDPTIGSRMINARAETLAEKPAFKNALAKRRCLIPADGFYEWQKIGTGKQPMHIRRDDGDLFAFAGLWEEWDAPDGSPLRTCTIITVGPNPLVAPIHDRMPAMLLPEAEAAWLDPANTDRDAALALLRPYPAESMTTFAVSRRVNVPALDDPSLLEPIEPGIE